MITRPATPANARPRPRRRALTVLAAAAPLLLLASQLRLLPQEDFVYLADTAWAPYGERSTEEIQQRSLASFV